MVRGMRSLSSSGRTMMNCPGCALRAIRGASMLSLVTVGFKATFCVILYMAKTPLYTIQKRWFHSLSRVPDPASQVLLYIVSRDNAMQIVFLQKMQNYVLTRRPKSGIICFVAGQARPAHHMECAAVAHLVERHLAKVEVASSSLVGRSILWKFSSAGRASALQAEGQRFEPVNFHHVAR